jgi:xylulose-5-phosphate/fructose-6-phosphate phosphoketolase
MPHTEAVQETLRTSSNPLTPEELRRLHAYWSAANYLTVGQIYLKDNPLLERPLARDDIKPRLLGHWGTTAGISSIPT